MEYRRRAFAGFTLIEIAVVLVIIGFMAVAGLRLTTALVDSQHASVTRQNLDQIKTALQGYVTRTGRLPCPSIETLSPGPNPPPDPQYGLEAATPGTCTGTTLIDAPAPVGVLGFRGVVPWKTLGLTTDRAFDGWGSQITYVVTDTATNLTFDTVAGMRGKLYTHSNAPPVAGLTPTGNQINACNTTAEDNGCNAAAAAILISYGRNIAGAFQPSGARAPLPDPATHPSETENTNTDRMFVIAEPSDTFDDVLVPLGPNDLLGTLYSQGVLRPEQSLLTERAHQIVSLLAGEAVANRDVSGGAGTYSYPLPSPSSPTTSYTLPNALRFLGCSTSSATQNIGPFGASVYPGPPPPVTGAANVKDPWGNPFQFGRADSLGIKAASVCVTPIVIVSAGADGAFGNADDVVYYASLQEWKTIFQTAGW